MFRNLSQKDEVIRSNISKYAIAHLIGKFPGLTVTFIYREIMALQKMGLKIDTFSIWRPDPDQVSSEAMGFIDTTFYIFPLKWLKFVRVHFYFLVTRPVRYIKTFFFVLTRPGMRISHRRRTFFHFLYAIYMAAEVERRGLQHIHAHFALNAATAALVISRLLGITYSITAHANDIFDDPVLLKEKLENAKFVITISEYNHHYLQGIATTSNIHIVNYGLDLSQFQPLTKRTNSELPIILAVGRLVEKKGYPDLIQACRILVERGYRFKCKIVGDGPQKDLLQRLIAEANLDEVVTLEGLVLQEHLVHYWKQATIFALPCVVAQDGDRDGMPNVLIEAMALQIPVVSTSLVGIPEFVGHGHSGFLAPPGDTSALADVISELLDDETLRVRMAYNARIAVEEYFDLDRNVSKLLGIYAQYGLIESVGTAHFQEMVSP